MRELPGACQTPLHEGYPRRQGRIQLLGTEGYVDTCFLSPLCVASALKLALHAAPASEHINVNLSPTLRAYLEIQ